jgi:AAA15 family ATPase/GTPase
MTSRSEIRDSIIRELLEKNRKNNYKQYLQSIRLEKIRMFKGAQITFDFPVTALIGPNGGGKSTIIGAALSAYKVGKPATIFKKSLIGDDSMQDWKIEYEIIDRSINESGSFRFDITYQNNKWKRSQEIEREVRFLSINRTVPISESPLFSFRKQISFSNSQTSKKYKVLPNPMKVEGIEDIKIQAEKILGKSLSDFNLYEFQFRKESIQYRKEQVGTRTIDDGREVPIYKKIEVGKKSVNNKYKQFLYVGSDGTNTYSEFNFGSGETSIIRMVAEMEALPNSSLVLIEEIENGLHPVAVKRVVEYFIDLAYRKNIQIIFTTHSDHAISVLPSEAIWACVEGKLQQGMLSIESLRVISGRIDRRLALFVEDSFAKSWIENIIREKLGNRFEEVGIYPLHGDGNAVKIHDGHKLNPAITFKSLCFLDGDSKQIEKHENGIYKLPGTVPELTIFNSVVKNLNNNIALLTAGCQRPINQQSNVAEVVREVSRTNRDPHLLFTQVGVKLGFVPVEIIQGAFLSIWMQENVELVEQIAAPISDILNNR